MSAVVDVLLTLMDRFGYALIFVLGVGESLPLIGLVVPGHALLLASGVAASAGILDIRWVIGVAFVAGVIGDALSFWIARRWGQRLFDQHAHRFRIKPEHLEKSNRVFEKHGPFALVLVRFSFIARGLGPTLAGMSKMKWGTFWVYNVIGAAAWAVINGLGGYYGGMAFFALEGAIGRILAYTLLSAAGIIILYRLMRRFAPAFTRADLAVAIAGATGTVIFGIVANRVEMRGSANALDANIGGWTSALAPILPLLRIVHAASAPIAILVASAVLLGVLAYYRRAWEAILVALGIGGIFILAPLVVDIFGFTLADDYANSLQLPFPELRAAAMIVFAGAIAYAVSSRPIGALWRAAGLSAAFVLAALAAVAPIAAREAYPSAAIAGLALGISWLSVSILVVEFGVKRRQPSQKAAVKP